jgi:hypothetical protein
MIGTLLMYRGTGASIEDSQSSNLKRYALAWTIAGLILLIDVLWLRVDGYSVVPASFKDRATLVSLLVCVFILLRGVQKIPRYRQLCAKLRYSDVSNTLAWYIVLIVFLAALSVLSYLCVALDRPLIDNDLVRFDRTMGFDWLALYRWVQSHTVVHRILAAAYISGWWQLIAIPTILGLSGRRAELSTFFFLIALSSLYLVLISTPFPAVSAFEHFHISDATALASVSDFPALRAGSLRMFDLSRMQGLVSLPSYHATLAVIFVYAVRRIALLLWPAVVLNLIMLVSTPTQGGHYLADSMAGVILALLTIVSFAGLLRWNRGELFAVPARIAGYVAGLFGGAGDRLRRF